jgi:hypothetical protein
VNSADHKNMRSQERTVAEAIELVRQWRGLHLNCAKPNNSRKKVNLQEAARMLGVSKKSLDDYYCQLRLAEQFGFEFEKHLPNKMGVLRSFVKDRKSDEEHQKPKLHRHPKNLRIIEDSEFKTMLFPQIRDSAAQSQDSVSVKAPSESLKNGGDELAGNPRQLTEINYL